MRVLIADDEIEISKALKVLLERSCFLVDIVFDGISAWDAVRCTGYDVIVLDIMMPGMDGLTVLKKLREAGNATPVLLLTAKAEVEIVAVSGGTDVTMECSMPVYHTLCIGCCEKLSQERKKKK